MPGVFIVRDWLTTTLIASAFTLIGAAACYRGIHAQAESVHQNCVAGRCAYMCSIVGLHVGPSGPCMPHWWPYTRLPRLSFGPGWPSTFPSCPNTSGSHCWDKGRSLCHLLPHQLPSWQHATAPLCLTHAHSLYILPCTSTWWGHYFNPYTKPRDYLASVSEVHSTVAAGGSSLHPHQTSC